MTMRAYRILDSRARCPRCGRFVPWSALGSEDRVDPDAHYGLSATEWTECPKCGRVNGIDIAPTKLELIEAAS